MERSCYWCSPEPCSVSTTATAERKLAADMFQAGLSDEGTSAVAVSIPEPLSCSDAEPSDEWAV
jgi:hypothetical protein